MYVCLEIPAFSVAAQFRSLHRSGTSSQQPSCCRSRTSGEGEPYTRAELCWAPRLPVCYLAIIR